jgi:hypothetical protein
VGLLKLLNRLSLLLNKLLRPPKELRLLPVDPKPVAARLPLSKLKRLPNVPLKLLVKLDKLLLRLLRLNVCKSFTTFTTFRIII